MCSYDKSVCVFVSMFVCVFVCLEGYPKRVLELPEWLLKIALSHRTWSMGTSLESSRRAASSLTSSPVFIKAELMGTYFSVLGLQCHSPGSLDQKSYCPIVRRETFTFPTHLRVKSTYSQTSLVFHKKHYIILTAVGILGRDTLRF